MTPRIPNQSFAAVAQRRIPEPDSDGQAFDAMQRVLSMCMPLFARAMESLTRSSSPDLLREGPSLP